MKYVLTLLLFASILVACNEENSSTTNETTSTEATAEYLYFGEEISPEGAMSFDDLLAKMKLQDSLETKVRGTVESVCQVKGCWMNIVSADGEEMFVKFKDYGFFMPKDIAGREVVMEGKVYREETTVEELRHYAEDEGQSAEEIAAITEPLEELKFMAHGVALLKE